MNTLRDHQRTISGCIAANKAARVDNAARYLLDNINNRLLQYLRSVNDGLANPIRGAEVARYLGDNWRGPHIASLIRESEMIRNPFERPVEESFEIGRAVA